MPRTQPAVRAIHRPPKRVRITSDSDLGYYIERAHGKSGNLLAILIKSPISEKRKQRDAIRSLGLSKIDSSAILPDCKSVRGQFKAAAHLLEVIELSGTVEILPPGGILMTDTLEHALRHDNEGSQLYQTGEFVEWHKRDNRRSLLWSTSLAADEMVAEVARTLGAPPKDTLGVVELVGLELADQTGETTADAAAKIASSHPDHVTFLRLDYGDGVAVLWSPSSGNDALGSGSQFGEANVIFDVEHVDSATKTMTATATKYMGAIASKVVGLLAA